MTEKDNSTSFEDIMCGDNQFWLERGIADRHIVGVLEAVNRNGKVMAIRKGTEYGSVPLLYRIYVFLWCVFFPIRAMILYIKSILKYKLSRIL